MRSPTLTYDAIVRLLRLVPGQRQRSVTRSPGWWMINWGIILPIILGIIIIQLGIFINQGLGYGGFLSQGGTPYFHPFLDGIFPEINHPAIGVPSFMETSKWR